MIRRLIFTVLFVFAFATVNAEIVLAGNHTNLPQVLISALKVYEQEGAEKFIVALLKGSTMEGDKNALSQSSSLQRIESFYGKYVGYEPSRLVKLSNSTSVYYYVMNYELGPLFGMATVYSTPNGQQIITTFNFHTKAENIYPQTLLK